MATRLRLWGLRMGATRRDSLVLFRVFAVLLPFTWLIAGCGHKDTTIESNDEGAPAPRLSKTNRKLSAKAKHDLSVKLKLSEAKVESLNTRFGLAEDELNSLSPQSVSGLVRKLREPDDPRAAARFRLA